MYSQFSFKAKYFYEKIKKGDKMLQKNYLKMPMICPRYYANYNVHDFALGKNWYNYNV